MTRITTTVETVSITDIKAGDTILRDGGERITVTEVIRCVPHLLTYRDAKGQDRLAFGDCALRVVPEQQDEPAEEEPVLPNADFIRIIRGTESGDRIDGSLAHRMGSLRRFILLDGPRAGVVVGPTFEGDAIFEWEEVVAVAKSAILASLGTTDDDTEDDTDDVDDEEETEDEDDCDGSCLACIITRLITAAAAGKGKEDEK